MRVLKQLQGRLVVSCQAAPSPSLEDSGVLAAIAKAAVAGGSAGIRADGPENVRAIRERTGVPVVGIWKRMFPDSDVFITPRLQDALAVAEAGAEVVAMDATSRPRPEGERLEEIVCEMKARTNAALMADVSELGEGLRAAELGFDCVSTTLSGYVGEPKAPADAPPDLDLVEALVNRLGERVPVVAEGRIASPDQAAEALRRGAFAVVVGTAITRPQVLTRNFCEALLEAS